MSNEEYQLIYLCKECKTDFYVSYTKTEVKVEFTHVQDKDGYNRTLYTFPEQICVKCGKPAVISKILKPFEAYCDIS